MTDKLKLLTGKNPKEYEQVAYELINTPDIELFKELVEKDDFLFDFVKENVARRLEKVCNANNYRNLFKLMKYYSPSYEELIVSTLSKYADEDLTDEILEIFETGNNDEKTYCAKYFSYIQDPLALDLLKANAKSENNYLSTNCISTLASFGDRGIYNEAINKLKSKDEFEVLDGVKTLVSYGDKSAVANIIQAIRNSAVAENIASELPYLLPLNEIIEQYDETGLYVLNLIINGLGETVALSQVFDFNLYEILDFLIKQEINSKIGIVLVNAKEKFETLTENNEYLYDETKDVKQEIYDIKSLLENVDKNKLGNYIDQELNPESLFVYSALDFSNNSECIRELLNCNNQTIILKAIEVLKSFKILTQDDKNTALKNVTNGDINNIILAM